MAKRHKMNRRKSERYFSATAGNQHVHPKNMFANVNQSGPMRSGIRL